MAGPKQMSWRLYRSQRSSLIARISYIDKHRAEVEEVHRQIEERNARGNPPEIRAKLEETHRRFDAFKAHSIKGLPGGWPCGAFWRMLISSGISDSCSDCFRPIHAGIYGLR